MEYPKRKSIRLQGYDYSKNGAYFITICTKDRRNLMWKTVGAIINRPPLSVYGVLVENTINEIENHYRGVSVNKYAIMPNHVHAIVFLNNDEECGRLYNGRLIIAPTVSTIVQQMKRYVSKQVGFSFWQKSFHDHIIRNETEYQKIWRYIDENPVKWQEDCYYKQI